MSHVTSKPVLSPYFKARIRGRVRTARMVTLIKWDADGSMSFDFELYTKAKNQPEHFERYLSPDEFAAWTKRHGIKWGGL